jgi:hypothetical protein
MMSQAGHDFLFFDMEHAMFNWETMLNLVQASLLANICPLVRVTDLSYPLVARALDTGAQGIIIPRVETRTQVEAAVSFAKYPPVGRRGAGGDARYGYVRRDARTAVTEANSESMDSVQIESLTGVENLEAIATVPGLDVVASARRTSRFRWTCAATLATCALSRPYNESSMSARVTESPPPWSSGNQARCIAGTRWACASWSATTTATWCSRARAGM